jgi:hypothetical protein
MVKEESDSPRRPNFLPNRRWPYFFTAQGFFASQGFAAHGFLAAHGLRWAKLGWVPMKRTVIAKAMA